jgi:hypothetical protein
MDSSPAITLPLELRLRVVIQRESDGEHELYVAQCLDYDLAAQGSTLKELKERFERTLMGQIIVALANDEKPFANLARRQSDISRSGKRRASFGIDSHSRFPQSAFPSIFAASQATCHGVRLSCGLHEWPHIPLYSAPLSAL